MRIMGLDMGTKTIGVALSDSTGVLGQPLCVLARTSRSQDIDRLEALINENDVSLVVVGLPRNMDGTIGKSAHQVLGFVGVLRVRVSVPIVTWDERLSTVAAERSLLEADVSRRRRRRVVDSVAAAIVLQGYLDSLAAQGGSGGGSESKRLPGETIAENKAADASRKCDG